MERIQVGDRVVVVGDNDRGKTGKVARIVKKKNAVVVEGVKRVKRHLAAQPNRPGGILDVEAPIDVSNVMLVDPESGAPTRVRFEERDGQKVRIAVKSGAVIPAPERE